MKKIIFGLIVLGAFGQSFAAQAPVCPQLNSEYLCERTFSFFEDEVSWRPTRLSLEQTSYRLNWLFGSLVGSYILDGKTKTQYQFGQQIQTKASCESHKIISGVEFFATPSRISIVRQLELKQKGADALQLSVITSLVQGNSVMDESAEHWKCQSSSVKGSTKKSRND